MLHEFALNECAYPNNLLFDIYRGKPPVTNVLPSFKVAVYCKEFNVLVHPTIKQEKHERSISQYVSISKLDCLEKGWTSKDTDPRQQEAPCQLSSALCWLRSCLQLRMGSFWFSSCHLPPDIFALHVLGRYNLGWAVHQLCAMLTTATVSKAHLILAQVAAGPNALPFYHWWGTTPLLSGI